MSRTNRYHNNPTFSLFHVFEVVRRWANLQMEKNQALIWRRTALFFLLYDTIHIHGATDSKYVVIK
jgi:hypothetical protein